MLVIELNTAAHTPLMFFLEAMNKAAIVSPQEFVMGIKEMPRLARFIPKIMLAITVTACDEVYRKIACWLNDMGKTQASGLIQIYSFIKSTSSLT